MSKTDISIDDYILWIEELVMKYGVELDMFAWQRLKRIIKECENEQNRTS